MRPVGFDIHSTKQSSTNKLGKLENDRNDAGDKEHKKGSDCLMPTYKTLLTQVKIYGINHNCMLKWGRCAHHAWRKIFGYESNRWITLLFSRMLV